MASKVIHVPVKAYRGGGVHLHSFLTVTLDGREVITPTPWSP